MCAGANTGTFPALCSDVYKRQIYSGELTLDQGLAEMQTLVDTAEAP